MKGSSKSELKEKAAKQMMGQIGPYIEDAEWEKSSAELRGALPEEYKVSSRVAPDTDLAGFPANIFTGYPAK